MANTYQLISSNTLSATAASVTFSSIPATFDNLILHLSVRAAASGGGDRIKFVFNGDTSNLYAIQNVVSIGPTSWGSAGDNGISNVYMRYTNDTTQESDIFGSARLVIPSYRVAINKSMGGMSFQAGANSSVNQSTTAGLYRSGSAITSIEILPQTGDWAVNSSFWLYGIKNS